MSAEIDPDVAWMTTLLLDAVGQIQERHEATRGRLPNSAMIVYSVLDENGDQKWDYKYTQDMDCMMAAVWGEAVHDIELGRFTNSPDHDED